MYASMVGYVLCAGFFSFFVVFFVVTVTRVIVVVVLFSVNRKVFQYSDRFLLF